MAAMISTSWRIVRKTFCWFAFFQMGTSIPALAQNTFPYLKSATLYLASDGWVDIWLNGIPIRESQPSTPDSKGFQVIQCLPAHLCYFQTENVLAIENANAFHAPAPLNSQVGIAYILQLHLSDGTGWVLSSNDVSAHKAYYIPSREMGEPGDWHHTVYDDQSWPLARTVGTSIPGVSMLTDLGSGQGIQFLSASGMSPKARYPGERHLYRRAFHLDIAQNPTCPPPEVQAVKRPAKRTPAAVPTPVPTVEAIRLVPTLTPSFTATPRPVFIWKPSPTPTVPFHPTWVPTPIPTWTFTFYPTAIPTSVPVRVIRPTPPWPPVITRVRVPVNRPRWRKPTPTAFPVFGLLSRAEPIQTHAPLVVAPSPTPPPAARVTAEPPATQGQTIVFESQPANIYVSFADGPGVYRLEVFDSSERHLRALFEKRIVAQSEDWVEWDGRNDLGQEMPAGQYIVLYTKDGRELNKLIVVKSANH